MSAQRARFNALRALGSSSTAVKFRHFKTLFLKGHFRALGSPPKFCPHYFFKRRFFEHKSFILVREQRVKKQVCRKSLLALCGYFSMRYSTFASREKCVSLRHTFSLMVSVVQLFLIMRLGLGVFSVSFWKMATSRQTVPAVKLQFFSQLSLARRQTSL